MRNVDILNLKIEFEIYIVYFVKQRKILSTTDICD